MQMSYRRFAAMIATSTLVMFGLMYIHTYIWHLGSRLLQRDAGVDGAAHGRRHSDHHARLHAEHVQEPHGESRDLHRRRTHLRAHHVAGALAGDSEWHRLHGGDDPASLDRHS